MAGRATLSDDQWAQIQALWEADPKMSYGEAGAPFGVGKSTVHSRAKRYKWAKRIDNAELAKRAHAKADQSGKATAEIGEKIKPRTKDIVAAARELDPKMKPDPTPEQREVAEQAAVDVRASLIDRHREEWEMVRKRIHEAAEDRDFDKAKLGKITAEATKILQDGERKAWGLDAVDGENEVKVIIERG